MSKIDEASDKLARMGMDSPVAVEAWQNAPTIEEEQVAVQKWLAHPDEELVHVIEDPWTDEGQLCFAMQVCGIRVEWLMAGPDAYAAAKYASTSGEARHDLIRMLNEDPWLRGID